MWYGFMVFDNKRRKIGFRDENGRKWEKWEVFRFFPFFKLPGSMAFAMPFVASATPVTGPVGHLPRGMGLCLLGFAPPLFLLRVEQLLAQFMSRYRHEQIYRLRDTIKIKRD